MTRAPRGPGLRAALVASFAPVVAVSPLVGGQAVKGPTAKLMGERGRAVDGRAGRGEQLMSGWSGASSWLAGGVGRAGDGRAGVSRCMLSLYCIRHDN